MARVLRRRVCRGEKPEGGVEVVAGDGDVVQLASCLSLGVGVSPSRLLRSPAFGRGRDFLRKLDAYLSGKVTQDFDEGTLLNLDEEPPLPLSCSSRRKRKAPSLAILERPSPLGKRSGTRSQSDPSNDFRQFPCCYGFLVGLGTRQR